MDWISIGALILAIAIPVAAGFAVATLGGGGDSDWYRSLDKPPWTPPNWVFPVMWTALYILMGVASWLVWKQGGFKAQGLPLGFYIAQALAFAGIVLLWVVILVTIVLFWHVNHNAAYLLLPYIIWVTLAASINLYIWIKNPNDGRPGYQDISRALNQGQIS